MDEHQTNLNVGSLLSNKVWQYDFMLRHDFFLPSQKSSLATAQFLHAAFTGNVYLPKQAKVYVCRRLNAPTKEVLKDMLHKILEYNKHHEHHGRQIVNLMEHLAVREADKDWYLGMIRHFDGENDIFLSTYFP